MGRSNRSPAVPSLSPLCSKGLTGYWKVSQNNMLHISGGDNHSPRSRARPELQTQQDVGKERGAPCRSLPSGSPCLHRHWKLQEAWAIVPQRRAPDLHSAKRGFPHATLTQDHSLLAAHSVETSLLFQRKDDVCLFSVCSCVLAMAHRWRSESVCGSRLSPSTT